MKNAALYVRVSTKDQNPEAQIDPLVRYAAARGLAPIEDEGASAFIDHGVSGAKVSRPAFDRMMERVRRREVDAVVVVKLDRLARSMRHLLDLSGELDALGVDLIVIDQGIDTTTPGGRLMFHVMGAVAEFERGLIIERTKAGVEAARKIGNHPGRPRRVTPEKRERILRLRRHGKSIGYIAEMMRLPNSVVGRELKGVPAGAEG